MRCRTNFPERVLCFEKLEQKRPLAVEVLSCGEADPEAVVAEGSSGTQHAATSADLNRSSDDESQKTEMAAAGEDNELKNEKSSNGGSRFVESMQAQAGDESDPMTEGNSDEDEDESDEDEDELEDDDSEDDDSEDDDSEDDDSEDDDEEDDDEEDDDEEESDDDVSNNVPNDENPGTNDVSSTADERRASDVGFDEVATTASAFETLPPAALFEPSNVGGDIGPNIRSVSPASGPLFTAVDNREVLRQLLDAARRGGRETAVFVIDEQAGRDRAPTGDLVLIDQTDRTGIDTPLQPAFVDAVFTSLG